ncbi:MAG: adenosylhomocysteinase [Thermoprotei archaeon]
MSAESGLLKIRWAEERMLTLGSLSASISELGVLRGVRVGVVLHIEAKTAVLALKLAAAGAEVHLAASNPLSTQDDVVEALRGKLASVHARRGESSEEYAEALRRVLAAEPDYLIDDGADAIALSHREGVRSVKGGCEETTTGVIRVRNLERAGLLRYPVVAVNDANTKHLFDNRFGSGQSVVDGLMRATNMMLAGKRVVVVGYGWVGRGVAQRLRGMGARVVVCEVDAVRAIEAYMDGFEVEPLLQAAANCDVIITATGDVRVVREEHFRVMRDGTLLANAGHFNVEVDVDHLEKHSSTKRVARSNVTEYVYAGRRLYVLGEGRLLNLVAADGHPIEVMDMSFSAQLLALRYLVENSSKLQPRLIRLPEELDTLIAKVFLTTRGVRIDELTEEQKHYLESY